MVDSATKRPILDLDTVTEHETIRIDGVHYEVANPDDFGVLDQTRISKWGAAISELTFDDAAESEEAAAQLADVLDRVCRMVLPGAPDEVHAKLTDDKRLRICMAFFELHVPDQAEQTKRENPDLARILGQ